MKLRCVVLAYVAVTFIVVAGCGGMAGDFRVEMVDDTGPIARFLRRDVLRNQCFLQAVESGIPPAPREVWTARRGEEIVGVMLVEDFGAWTVARLTVIGRHAVPALVAALDTLKRYRFSVHSDVRDELLAAITDTSGAQEVIAFFLAPEQHVLIPQQGEFRRLTMADRQIMDGFPPPENPYEPTVTNLVRDAEANPSERVVYGIDLRGALVGFEEFGHVVDRIWEEGTLRVRDEYRGRGELIILSHATKMLLDSGRIPLVQVAARDEAGVKRARDVGYRERYRTFACDARPVSATRR